MIQPLSAWLLAGILAAPAAADSFTLANGSAVEGSLATWELGGNCRIFVSEGDFRGATLLLPCEEILAFRRQGAEAPALAAARPDGPLVAPTPDVEALVVETLPVEQVEAPAAPMAIPADARVTEAPAASTVQVVPTPEEPAPPQVAVVEQAPPQDPPAGAVVATLPPGYELPAARAAAPPAAAPPAAEAPAPPPLAEPTAAEPTADSGPADSDPAGALDDALDDALEDAAAEDAPEDWSPAPRRRMPRWLYRALYGESPPEEPTG